MLAQSPTPETAVRSLGIDFGERRIGLAISDESGRLATPLTTLVRVDDAQVVAAIGELVTEHGVRKLYLGKPTSLDGSDGPAVARIEVIAGKLEKALGLPCELVPETLTTVEAKSRLRAAGVDVRKYPERIDAVAAQLLLQEGLDGGEGR